MIQALTQRRVILPFTIARRRSGEAKNRFLRLAALAVSLSSVQSVHAGSWSSTGSLHTGRYSHAATLLPGGQVLVAGGSDSNLTPLSSAELYDPAAGNWSVTGSMAKIREYHTATLLPNGKVLVAGGSSDGLGALVQAELYDPAAGKWTAAQPMNAARRYHTATLLTNGTVLVAGGDSSGAYLVSAELYDPVSGKWTATGSLNTGRNWHTATLLSDGRVLVAGGFNFTNGVILASAEIYDPASGQWTVTGSLNTARYSSTATLLPNGKVLVAGGRGSNNVDPAPAELYDPASGVWTVTGSLQTGCDNHSATLLPNGTVLVAGGSDTNDVPLYSTELYYPVSGSWTADGSLGNNRYSHTATLLPNGHVLVAGGVQAFRNALASAEIYDSGLAFLVITNLSPLPADRVGVAYNEALGATGGTLPYTWAVASGPLPAGLSLSTNGVISGTPTAVFNSSFTIKVTDQTGQSVTNQFSLVISAAGPPAITTTSPLPGGFVGVAYSQTLQASGGTTPYTWSVISGTLPTGLKLSSAGVISGKPTAARTSTFTVKVTAAGGLAATNKFSLTISTPDRTKPTLTISGPASGVRLTTPVVTVKGTAKDNQQVSAVWCRTNGVWGTAQTANHWANWTIGVALVPGTNLIKAYAVDTSSNYSTTQSVSVVYVVTSKLVVQTTGPSTMNPNYNGSSLELGKSYTTTVTPGKGYVLSNWVATVQGNIVFVSTATNLTFTMQSNLVLQANIILNPFTPVKGTYNGLFGAGTANQDGSGFFTLTLSDSGSYSGSLKRGSSSYPFSGKFDVSGASRQVVSRPKTNAWIMGMALDFPAQQLQGWVSNGVSGGWVADVLADRAVFNAKTNPATQYAGDFTLSIPGGTNADGTVWLGDGYLTLSVDTGGNVTYSGSVADGTAVGPATVPVSADGTIPLYAGLYSGKGSIWSWLGFDTNQPAQGLGGALSWIKLASAGAIYPAGLTNTSLAVGSRYTPPAKSTTRALDLTNAFAIFEGGNLSVPLTNTIMVTSSNKVIDLTLTNKLSLSITVSNGVFSGSVREPGLTRSNVFRGVMLDDENSGYGYFLETNRSGRVRVVPVP